MSETVAIVGQRSMVGSVLRERMLEENDFAGVDVTYFSTSQAGQPGPDGKTLQDANDLDALSDHDVIITTQGSNYTTDVHTPLRAGGWSGFWIDAASKLRYEPDSIPILDPVNRDLIDAKLEAGQKDLIGANCTVSTAMMGLTPLYKNGHIEWVSDMTYQAASGAGAQHMRELLRQMAVIGLATQHMIDDPAWGILDIDRRVQANLMAPDFPKDQWGVPLAASLIPWIDKAVDGGQTREEWKGGEETNNILGLNGEARIAVDGICVRVGSMRSHAHAMTIKLREPLPLDEIEAMIAEAHEWVSVVTNEETETKNELTSAAASGDLVVRVGRLRKMAMGPEYLSAFVVGDQLLWGAAEPLRRALRIVTNAGN